MKFSISKHHKRRNFSVSWLREGRKRSVKFTAYPDYTFLKTLSPEAFFRDCFLSKVMKTSKISNFLPPFPQPEIEKIYSSMVCTDTKLHAEIIKLLFWNFYWGQYISVSHLDSVKDVDFIQKYILGE